MLTADDEASDAPAHWLVYFAVGDCDASAAKAARAGATLVVPPSDIPGVGRFAVATDPQGAAFAMIELDTADPN
jgi:hypothetical protein